MNKLIELKNVCREFTLPQQKINVLENVSFDICEGDFIAIEGASGSGKSTLLHIIGLLDQKFTGDIFYQGVSMRKMSSAKKSHWRNKCVGFVFQFFHLLSSLTVLENVMLPQLILKVNKKKAHENALKWLDRVGLSERVQHFPHELSGGEQQRIALARALSNKPLCVFLDEPTGNLDDKTSLEIENLVEEINSEFDVAMVLVTHNSKFAQKQKKRFYLSKSQISSL